MKNNNTFEDWITILFGVILLVIAVVFVVKTQTLSIQSSFMQVAGQAIGNVASSAYKKMGEMVGSIV